MNIVKIIGLSLLLSPLTAQIPDSTGGGGSSTLGANIDFSAKTTTKPVKAGTSLPGTCSTSELFLDTDATAGEGLYQCTSTNVWTRLTSVGAYGPADKTSATSWTITGATHNLGTCSVRAGAFTVSGDNWTEVMGIQTCNATYDVTLTFGVAVAGKMAIWKTGGGGVGGGGTGDVVGPANNTDAYFPRWNGADSKTLADGLPGATAKTPSSVALRDSGGNMAVATLTADAITAASAAGTINFSAATATRPFKVGTTAPETCTTGDLFFDSDATAGGNLTGCTSSNVWTTQGSTYTAGTAISIADGVISADNAVLSTFLTEAASIDPSSISNGSCSYHDITVSGAATGEAVSVGAPNSADDGIVAFAKVKTGGGVVRLSICNFSGGAVDLGNLTWRVWVHKVF